MKITNRMKKILLYLSRPEKAYQWFLRSANGISFPERYYVATTILSFCEKGKPYWDFTHSEKVSYKRTFRILEKLDLVKSMQEYPHPDETYYELTNNGKKIVEKVEEEIRNIIEEYEDLI